MWCALTPGANAATCCASAVGTRPSRVQAQTSAGLAPGRKQCISALKRRQALSLIAATVLTPSALLTPPAFAEETRFVQDENADDDVVTRSRLDALLEAKASKRTEMSYTDPSAGNPARKLSPIQVGTVFVGAAWVIGFAGVGTLIRPQLSRQAKAKSSSVKPSTPIEDPPSSSSQSNEL